MAERCQSTWVEQGSLYLFANAVILLTIRCGVFFTFQVAWLLQDADDDFATGAKNNVLLNPPMVWSDKLQYVSSLQDGHFILFLAESDRA